MDTRTAYPLGAIAGAALCIAVTSTWAQVVPTPPQHYEPHVQRIDGDPGAKGAAVSEVIQIEDAAWVRLDFGDYHLGDKSTVTIRSLADEDAQTLDTRAMVWWSGTSAFFNGDAVAISLDVADGDEGVFVEVEGIVVGEYMPGDEKPAPGQKTLCGADSRVASTDARVGRTNMGGCTAWLTSNGSVLTAGHCLDGTRPPDGTPDLTGSIQFNPPASLANGTTQAATAANQYPINNATRVGAFDGDNNLGDDWGVFGLNPNNTNGDRAHLTRGFFRMTRENPSAGNTIRITGYGVDDTPAGSGGGPCCRRNSSGVCTSTNCNAQNMTEQTSTGSYVDQQGTSGRFFHRYATDTEPANSGSPIIWNTNGYTIGIHTNGGCNSDGSGANQGTSFEHNPLEVAIRDFPGTNTEYVDFLTPPTNPTEDGSVFRPWDTVTEGVAGVASGRNLAIVEGSYTAANGNTFTAGADGKAFTIIAPVGSVTIGN